MGAADSRQDLFWSVCLTICSASFGTKTAHMKPEQSPVDEPEALWRSTHLGRHLERALARFDAQVRRHMASQAELPLALSNLAASQHITAAHLHITRHLPLGGARLVALAELAGMSKQAMGDLVDQCEAWGLVQRLPDPLDARARRVVFTADGLLWLQAHRLGVAQAEAEFRQAVGAEVATVVALGLEAYAG